MRTGEHGHRQKRRYAGGQGFTISMSRASAASPSAGRPRFSVAFELSGENPRLAAAEASALLDLLDPRHSDRLVHPLVLISRTTASPAALAGRTGLSQAVLDVWETGKGGVELAEAALRESESTLGTGETFRVRARAPGGQVRLPADAEARLGLPVFRRGFAVDLRRPDAEVRALFYPGGFLVGRAFPADRGGLRARSPRLRPFFHPGVIKPPLARALVNLCRLRTGTLLDPACGTAGILVEAGMLGLRPLGCDAQPRMAAGARRNLAHYGLGGEVLLADARRLPLRGSSVAGVATDLPYGRSSRLAAAGRVELYRGVCVETARVLPAGARAVLCADFDVSDFARAAGLSVEETHRHRVHRSLTRHVAVCRAKG